MWNAIKSPCVPFSMRGMDGEVAAASFHNAAGSPKRLRVHNRRRQHQSDLGTERLNFNLRSKSRCKEYKCIIFCTFII